MIDHNGEIRLIGFVNFYRYSTGRIHTGTGFYSTREEADYTARHKKNRIACSEVTINPEQFTRKDMA